MSKYIDADFEIAHYTSMTTNPTPDVTEKDKRNSLIILDALRMAKAIDIVRCKECRWGKPYSEKQLECDALGLGGLKFPDDFCSYGEPSSSEKPNNSTISKMEQVDEPQLTPNYCGTCRHRDVPCGDLPCDVCHGYSNYAPQDEPQTMIYPQVDGITPSVIEPQTDAVGVPMAFIDEAKFKAHCLNCQRDVADIKCLDCDGDKYFLPDEPQTDCAWR